MTHRRSKEHQRVLGRSEAEAARESGVWNFKLGPSRPAWAPAAAGPGDGRQQTRFCTSEERRGSVTHTFMLDVGEDGPQ